MAYKIILDAGHGGSDPGAVYEDRLEKDDVLDLALAVGLILEQEGYDVEYTRTEDIYETPYEKAVEGNTSGADLFVSLHRNSVEEPNTASGVVTLVYDQEGIKYDVAQAINEELARVGYKNLGVTERPDLVVLRRTEMPSLLVEVGFINNDADNELFDTEFNAIAQGIADGIMSVVEGDMGNGNYQVQVGSYRNRIYADELESELLAQGFPVYIDYDGRGYYTVKVGSFEEFSNAILMEQRLKRAGYPTLVVTS